jgi:hypothetical protein
MKKICSLLLIACTFSLTFAASAKNHNTKDAKDAKNAKDAASEKGKKTGKTGGTDPVTGTVKGVGTSPSEDTTGTDPALRFYNPKHKRLIDIPDVYVGVGGGLNGGQGGVKSPFYSGATINFSYGVPLYNKRLLLEINNNADFMFAPNKEWFAGAFALKPSVIHGVELGFNDELSMGLHIVIAGSRFMSLTAGPVGGGRMTNLPSMRLNGSQYYLAAPFSFCYGLKANLFIGNRFYCYAQYSNSTSTTVGSYKISTTSNSTADYAQTVQRVPVNYGVFRVGAVLELQPWW